MRLIRLLALLSVGASAVALPAAAMAGDFSIGLSGSTLGLGGEVSYSVSPHFTLRGVGHALSINLDGNRGDVDYAADLKLGSGGLYLDWFPAASGRFHVTLGGLINGNEITATGKPMNGVYTIGGNTFTVAQVGTLDGKVDFNSAAPYVGVGWLFGAARDRTRHGFGWGLDIGTMFEGSPKVTLTSTGGTQSSNPILLDSLKTEEQKYEDDINFLRIYPVVDFAVLYRF